MKIRNIFFTSILLVITTILFSSCEEGRYYWSGGELDRKASFRTDGRGQIYSTFRVELQDLYFDGYGNIRDVRFLGYEEIILTVNSSDVLHEIWLSIPGTGESVPFYNVRGQKGFKGGDIVYFMETVVDQLRRYGYVDINVEAFNDHGYSNIYLDVQLFADIEVYLRD